MAEKCCLCNEKIQEGFLGKINGTVIKVKINSKNSHEYVCSDCQKKHGENLKKVASEKK